MPRRVALCLLLCLVRWLPLCAQSFGWTWIGAPSAEAGQQYWFRRTYTHLGALRRATLRVATTGWVQVYVNGRRVCTDPLLPLRVAGDARALARNFDVTPFVRTDSVTVALWYAPLAADTAARGCQVAATLFGTDADGHAFSLHSDAGWMCRPAPGGFAAGEGWWADGRGERDEWTDGASLRALWRPAVEDTLPVCTPVSDAPGRWRLRRVVAASVSAGAHGLSCHFPYPFRGLLRATLRGARPDAALRLGPWLTYVCSGEMDEQPCLRFSPLRLDHLDIEGGVWLTPDVVQGVEGLELEPFVDMTF